MQLATKLTWCADEKRKKSGEKTQRERGKEEGLEKEREKAAKANKTRRKRLWGKI